MLGVADAETWPVSMCRLYRTDMYNDDDMIVVRTRYGVWNIETLDTERGDDSIARHNDV